MRKTLNKLFIGSLIAFSFWNVTAKSEEIKDLDINSIKFPALNEVIIPEVQKETLKNGLRIYLLEDHSLPLIDVFVRVNIGSYLEPKNQIGLSDMVGSLLREGGTEKWSPDELDDLLESTGASVESEGDIVFHSLSLNMLSSQKDLAVEIMNQILLHPRFDDTRFSRLVTAYKSGIARRNDNPASVASREFEKMIYGKDSVFAAQTEYAHLNNIKREDLLAFHKRYYKPEFVMMAICGDFNAKEMLNLLKKHFEGWEKGKETLPPIPEVKYNFDQRVGYIEFKDAKQSNIFFGHIGGKAYDGDEPKRMVMNNILGGGFGSRYFNEVRSKAGLAYNVYGGYSSNYTYPGKFVNVTSTNCNTTLKAIRMMIGEIKKLQKEEVSQEELIKGKEPYLNRFVFNFDSKEKIVNRILSYDLFGLPYDHLQRQKAVVEKTTAADVKAMANKYLQPNSLRIVVCGDKKLFDEPLENLNNGKVEEIDITIPME